MLKVIIVDDEVLVRLGIKTYIEDSGSEIQVQGTFSSAKDALEFCRKSPPDVILTDIKMPGMDGLELIQHVKKEFPLIKFVVLSCHEDFKFVRKAFTLGVEEYILKHEVEKDELMNVLNKIKKQIESRKRRSDIDNQNNNSNVSRLNKSRHHNSVYIVAAFDFKCSYNENFEKISPDVDINILAQIVQEILNKSSSGQAFIRKGRELICIFEQSKTARSNNILSHVKTVVEDIQANLLNYFNHHVIAAISNILVSMGEIKKGYQQVRKALEYKFYYKHNKILFYSDISAYEQETDISHTLPLKFEFYLKNPYEEWNNAVEEYFKHVMEHKTINPLKVKKDIDVLMHELNDALKENFNISIEKILKDPLFVSYKQIDEFDDICKLMKWTKYILHKIWKEMKSRRAFSCIGAVKEYINQKYAEDITLKSVSKHFYINMNYFCQFFKKETGMNFTTYLNKVRVENAKKLIMSTDMSLEEIAVKVGYNNSNYFSRVFKKVCGMTVSEYRKTLIL